jgi:hypothetical protein
LIGAAPDCGSAARIFGWWNAFTPTTEPNMQKVLVDFSLAAMVALAIGIAVGGTAFSFVWLIAVLNA